jgi:hypothetical protein
MRVEILTSSTSGSCFKRNESFASPSSLSFLENKYNYRKKKIFFYEFDNSFCCFDDDVLLISCLSLPCSVDNDCNSLFRLCNERPITSSLKRTPLLLLLR